MFPVTRAIAPRLIATASLGVIVVAVAALTTLTPAPMEAAAPPVEIGRFVWHDLLAKDVNAATRFYGDLLGWKFQRTKRGDRPYVLAKSAGVLVAGVVDISTNADAAAQWISYMAVANVDQSVDLVKAAGGSVLVAPRDLANARASVVADPQGAPLGLAQVKVSFALPDPATPSPNHLFWDEYVARDGARALAFYKQLGGYESGVSDTRLGVDYHVLRKSRPRAGLFELPAATTGVEPNWLPYVLTNDPSALAVRATQLGGRVLVAAAPERRNGTLVVIADPGGAPLALQKFPF